MSAEVLSADPAGALAILGPTWTELEALALTWSHPQTLAAVMVGAAAVFSGARFLLLAVALLLAADLAVGFGHLEAVPGWLLPACVALALLGVLQGVVTVIAGGETFGDLLLAILGLALAAMVLVLWKWPGAMLLRALARGGRP